MSDDEDARLTIRIDNELLEAFDDAIFEAKYARDISRDESRSSLIRGWIREFCEEAGVEVPDEGNAENRGTVEVTASS